MDPPIDYNCLQIVLFVLFPRRKLLPKITNDNYSEEQVLKIIVNRHSCLIEIRLLYRLFRHIFFLKLN